MAVSAEVKDVAPIIQLAVAPVFLLTAVGALVGVARGVAAIARCALGS